jgi:hypothetical protein
MPKNQPISAIPASVLARRVLDVWRTNDDAGLEKELSRVLRQTRSARLRMEIRGAEAERQELIRAIATSIGREGKTANDRPQESRLEVWAGLLDHLSAGDSVSFAQA